MSEALPQDKLSFQIMQVLRKADTANTVRVPAKFTAAGIADATKTHRVVVHARIRDMRDCGYVEGEKRHTFSTNGRPIDAMVFQLTLNGKKVLGSITIEKNEEAKA
jgi:hypothetical protein